MSDLINLISNHREDRIGPEYIFASCLKLSHFFLTPPKNDGLIFGRWYLANILSILQTSNKTRHNSGF